jgi:lon-related putative ATP-dependent protease
LAVDFCLPEDTLSLFEPLPPDLLRAVCDPDQFDFQTTAELQPVEAVIGQDRAIEAIRFGVAMRRPGFNVFAFGPPGTGKRTAVRHFLQRQAATMSAPDAWCYVFNFDDARCPTALCLPNGRAVALRADIHRAVEELLVTLPAVFESDAYAARRESIASSFDGRAQTQFDAVAERAAERGLALVRGPEGAGLVPLANGEVMSPDAYAALPPERQVALRSVVEGLNPELDAAVRSARALEREAREALSALDREVARAEVDIRFDELRERYAAVPPVVAYLDRMQDDILDHLDDFRVTDDGDSSQGDGASVVHHPDAAAAARWRRRHDARLRRYDVNVLVDTSDQTGAPVVEEVYPTLGNLVGRIEQRPEFGTLVTDFSLIKPGALHRANGGFLVLQAEEILKQPFAWDALKRALRHAEIRIEAQVEDGSPFGTVSLSPEPVPLDCRVVLVGEDDLFFHLAELDPDLHELWKVPAEFAEVMPRTPETTQRYAQFLATVAHREGLLPLTRTAVAALVEHGARLAEDSQRLSTRFMDLADVVREADFWAAERGAGAIAAADVARSLEARERRSDLAREQMLEAIERDLVLVETDGEAVGRVNGLTVVSRGQYDFGVPVRISARVRLGGGEVLDIEREVDLGGPIHSKGVLILGGFLAGRYLTDESLAMSASLTFEQSYAHVDGDSASCAELVALLSALSGLPVQQGLAVTGSINQDGEVQAVGGVNDKIEGFFDVCAQRGLTGQQGVVLPAANIQHLMLRPDVQAAAAAGSFHLYAVRHVDEALALLTGRPAGERGADGEYGAGTVNRLVEDRLRVLAEKRRETRADSDEGDEAHDGAEVPA